MSETDVQKELQALRKDFAALQADVGQLAGALRDTGVQRAEKWRSSMEDEWKDGREALSRRMDTLRTGGRKRLDELEEGVGEHPFGALLTAFGIGFIVGKLLDLGGRR